MTVKTSFLGAFALALALTSATSAGPADAAEPLRVSDSRQDVLREARACPGTGCAPTLRGRTKPAADIVRLRADYDLDLTLSLKVAGTARRVVYAWRIHAADTDVVAAIFARGGRTKVRYFDSDGEAVTCDGLTGALDPARRIASVAVPATCFGSADRVRIGAQVVMLTRAYAFVDDAQRDRFRWRGVHRSKLGPAVTRAS